MGINSLSNETNPLFRNEGFSNINQQTHLQKLHMNYNNNPCHHILIAEDNPGDVMLIQKAFDQIDFGNNIHTVTDGEEAIQFLRQKDTYTEKPRPDLVLLDLNMPRKDGIDVLESMTERPELQQIPVVILTSSEAEEDIVKSYNHQANAYLVKPTDFSGFVELVDRLKEFWFGTAEFPHS